MDYRQEFLDAGTERIGLHHYPAPDDPDAPLIVLFPAMGTPARFYRRFAAELLGNGVGVIVVDLRGTGSSTPTPARSTRYGYTELVADVGIVLDSLAAERAGRRTILLGHSLGGQLSLLHLATTRDATVDGLALVACGLPYWRRYVGLRRFQVLPMTQAIGAVAAVLRYWPGWAFGGRQARGVIRDWAYTARTGRFPRIDGADVEPLVRKVTTPVLAISMEHDRFTPGSTLDHLCGKLDAAPVDRRVYTVAEAGGPLDHFVWARRSAGLAVQVAAFAGKNRYGTV